MIHYRPVPRMPPRPSKHVLATPPHECPGGDTRQCSQHGSHPPLTTTFQLSTSRQQHMEYKQQGSIPPWDIDTSVFAPRKKEACAFFDTGCEGLPTVLLRARWVTLRARWETLGARWVT